MSEKQTEAQRLAALCDSEVVATVARDILMHETAAELRRPDAVEKQRDQLLQTLIFCEEAMNEAGKPRLLEAWRKASATIASMKGAA